MPSAKIVAQNPAGKLSPLSSPAQLLERGGGAAYRGRRQGDRTICGAGNSRGANETILRSIGEHLTVPRDEAVSLRSVYRALAALAIAVQLA